MSDEARADGLADVRQFFLRRALVENEEDAGRVEGCDGGKSQLTGIAGADADKQEAPHDASIVPAAG